MNRVRRGNSRPDPGPYAHRPYGLAVPGRHGQAIRLASWKKREASGAMLEALGSREACLHVSPSLILTICACCTAVVLVIL